MGVLITADHASNAIPPDLGDLGVSEADRQRHIAWDIGTQALARALALRLECAAITAPWSRLVLDVNREPDHPGLIPHDSDGTAIPGNANLTVAERQRRFEAIHKPYHDAIAAALDVMAAPILISLHSFTPVMRGIARPWHVGLLYNRQAEPAQSAIAWLRTHTDHAVGDNEPYSGRLLNYTMNRHAEARGRPYLNFEIRQDLLETDADVAAWAATLEQVIKACG